MQLKNHQKQSIVDNIKKSNTFKNAPTSIALLQYLFNATNDDVHLKEGVIDIEFFGNKESTEKNTPRVRVNVYNLRKKLTAYYTNEGNNDNWRVIIDKGQYKVRFEKTPSKNILPKRINWPLLLPYLGLLTAIIIIFYSNRTPNPSVIWDKFLSKDTPTNLFIGDHFGATGKTITNNMGWTRDFSINNVEEFYNLLDTKPELKNEIKPANYSYSTRMAALATQQFQQFYQHYNKSFDIRFTTQTSISEIKEGYAIYVGPTKNKNQFIHFFNEGNPYCKIKDNFLIIEHHPLISKSEIKINNTNHREEYAIVSKYPSINNTEHFVFFSQHDIGVSGTVEYFTNLDSLTAFKNKHLKNSEYFTAIFKVKGQDRTNTNIKLEMVVPF
ncbi:hypothetical protein GCM10022291_26720 [Postechiella marina]|uniref:Uncharacterized protein n=1 Tax=Postechiella marina TaxID=943941 RepID=A0ABP8CDJ6_9FLAO